MQIFNGWQDKIAIGLSFSCTLHCLLVPMLLFLFPSLTGSAFVGEQVHRTLLFVAVPISLLALTYGCKVHRKVLIGAVGGAGLLILSWTAFFGHEFFEKHQLGEYGESLFTLVGTLLMIFSHLKNLHFCRQDKHCC